MYTIEENAVFLTTEYPNVSIKEQIGAVEKIEVVRLDNNIVEDISYTFNLEQGQYIETGRVSRADVYVAPVDEIASLKSQVQTLTAMLGDFILGGI